MSFKGSIGHVTGIESPWAAAGGVIKTTQDVETIAKTGVGWIEDGSHVLGGKRLGNAWNPETEEYDRNVYDYDPATGITVNSLGMPGEGFDAVIKEVPERIKISHAHNKPYVLNVAPVSGDPENEIIEMARLGYEAGVDAVLINAGCPNVVTLDGGRHELLSRDPDALYNVLRRLFYERLPQPVWLRISPQKRIEDMREIAWSIRQSPYLVSAVFTPNTWPGYVPTDKAGNEILDVPGGEGGRSGPATADESLEQTDWAVRLISERSFPEISVVSSSGITTAHELQRRLDIGAVAGAGTTFFHEPVDGWAEDTHRLLSDFAS